MARTSRKTKSGYHVGEYRHGTYIAEVYDFWGCLGTELFQVDNCSELGRLLKEVDRKVAENKFPTMRKVKVFRYCCWRKLYVKIGTYNISNCMVHWHDSNGKINEILNKERIEKEREEEKYKKLKNE